MEYLDKSGTQELINQLKAFIDQYSGTSSISIGETETDSGKTLTINEGSFVSSNFLNKIYPIGAMYFTTDTDFDPATAFGGTWERISSDRYLMLAGTKYQPGTTGGSDTHKLTIDEMPAHTHTVTVGSYKSGNYSTSLFGNSGPSKSGTQTITTSSAGSGTAINIIPSYFGVAGWRRTA